MKQWPIPHEAEVDLAFRGGGGESFCEGIVWVEVESDVVELRTENSTITYDPDVVTSISVRWVLGSGSGEG